jgi:hypothetical protein
MSSARFRRDYTIEAVNSFLMLCPLCGERRARRGCPALDKQICPVCCGTKRLVQIQCPSDCTWLASAREHPPAVVVRRKTRDVGTLVQVMRDFNERQSRILFVIASALLGYEPPDLQGLIDGDVAEAAASLAATYETAARGVIYEHRPASLPAERLATALKGVLAEAGKGAPSSFDRDAAVVLRRLEEAIGEARAEDPSNRRAFLDLLARVIPRAAESAGEPPEPETSRLILP